MGIVFITIGVALIDELAKGGIVVPYIENLPHPSATSGNVASDWPPAEMWPVRLW